MQMLTTGQLDNEFYRIGELGDLLGKTCLIAFRRSRLRLPLSAAACTNYIAHRGLVQAENGQPVLGFDAIPCIVLQATRFMLQSDIVAGNGPLVRACYLSSIVRCILCAGLALLDLRDDRLP